MEKYDDLTEAESGDALWIATFWAAERGFAKAPHDSPGAAADRKKVLAGEMKPEKYVGKWNDYQLLSVMFDERANAVFRQCYAKFVAHVCKLPPAKSVREAFARGAEILDRFHASVQDQRG
jgi:hypothetical protein